MANESKDDSRRSQLLEQLLPLETGFWLGDASYYREHVDERCLCAFGKMAAALSREDVSATVEDGPRWSEPRIDVKGLIAPTPDYVVLTYEADAKRSNGEEYRALVSSGYVRRDERWKLSFHQQTPL